MPERHPFRDAFEAGDLDGAIALLAPEATFRSPVVFRPYEGAEAVATILRAAAATFEDFRYVREMGDLRDHALVFEARVGEKQIDGADFIRSDAEGRITDFMVMTRPLSATLALAEAMKARLTGAADRYPGADSGRQSIRVSVDAWNLFSSRSFRRRWPGALRRRSWRRRCPRLVPSGSSPPATRDPTPSVTICRRYAT